MANTPRRLPVTVFCGFAGAGKTTIVSRLIARMGERRTAVIANDTGQESSAGGAEPLGAGPVQPAWSAVRGGCACCSAREELMERVRRVVASGECDHLLVEAAGVAEPMALAELFEGEDERGEGLSDVAQLDTLVTVVDTERFLVDLRGEDELRARHLAVDDADERSVADVLIAQVEHANVLVLAKVDRVAEAQAAHVEALLRQLNPSARIVRGAQGDVPVQALVDTNAFELEAALQAPGWSAALRGEAAPADERHGLCSWVYRARAPFHPERLWKVLEDASTWEGIWRSRGFFWLASRMDVSGGWSQAGGTAMCEGAGPWYAALPEHEWPVEPDERDLIYADWVPPWGDRRQELAFIACNLDEAALRAKLDAALLDERELAAGPDAWANLPDPFPDWAGQAPPPVA